MAIFSSGEIGLTKSASLALLLLPLLASVIRTPRLGE